MDLFASLGSRLLRDPRDVRVGEKERVCERLGIVGVPWDWNTGGVPGARFAPSRIIKSMLGLPDFDGFSRSIQWAPRVYGEVRVVPGRWEETRERVRRAAGQLFQRGGFHLFVGGDHSITGPILEALLEGGSVGLLMFDAHFDMRSVREGVTSGMWLWEVLERSWGRLGVAILGVAPYANPGYLAERARGMGVRWVTSTGLEENIEHGLELVDWLASESYDRYYITIDMDHIAEACAPGVNSPNPLGVSPHTTLRILEYAVGKLRPAGADIVEVVPLRDRGDATVRLAALLGLRLLHLAGEVIVEC